MKLKAETNVVEFIRAVKGCAGDVCFTTSEGDRLNLSSMLSQCLFSIIASNEQLMSMGTIELQEPGDLERLKDYLAE